MFTIFIFHVASQSTREHLLLKLLPLREARIELHRLASLPKCYTGKP
jgi:hypothetical protein